MSRARVSVTVFMFLLLGAVLAVAFPRSLPARVIATGAPGIPDYHHSMYFVFNDYTCHVAMAAQQTTHANGTYTVQVNMINNYSPGTGCAYLGFKVHTVGCDGTTHGTSAEYGMFNPGYVQGPSWSYLFPNNCNGHVDSMDFRFDDVHGSWTPVNQSSPNFANFTWWPTESETGAIGAIISD